MTSTLGGSQISSPGIRAGTLLVPHFQYELLSPRAKSEFRKVYTASGTQMWRYKFAEIPYIPPHASAIKITADNDDILTRWQNDEVELYNRLLDVFSDMVDEQGVALVECDDDEEFTYGIFVAVLNELDLQESDWLLEHEFGNVYRVQNINEYLTTDD